MDDIDADARLDKRSVVPLDVDECLALLGAASLGRIAFVHEDEPVIHPVNYVLHEGTVVFRTSYGMTLDTVGSGARVAFEVDEYDAASASGWSVLVKGRAEEIWLPDELDAARTLPLHPQAPGDRSHYVRVAPSEINGRRIQ